MSELIVMAGATGNLGKRIARELRQRNVSVRALVRSGTPPEKLAFLQSQQIEVVPVKFDDASSLAQALEGATCAVSALLGLEKTMIGTQGSFLRAAVAAGVSRFIPSDYAMDFTKVAEGDNRNFDLHREFLKLLNDAPIRSTTILNGCFMHLLVGQAPLILQKIHRVLYWGKDPDQLMDFTTIEDTASFTADAALDTDAPRFLRIAGEQISARGLAQVASEVRGHPYRLLRGGSLRRLQAIISLVRKLTPQKDDPFPVWQGMQYLYCMFEGSGQLGAALDNNRYSQRSWTRVREVFGSSE